MTRDLPLEVVCQRRGEAAVLVVHGELDLSTVDALRQVLRSQEARASVVVLDLRELEFIDSSGLSLIVSEQQRASDDGFNFAVAVGGAPAVQRLFELTGLRDTLTLVDDPDAALPA
ncbi:MAG TPA: STAS domain-containing protein [Solirubrobacteraceae bacterium]|nr:STAS domain-containing protein [Solirubrobacteraceae bacterium]